MNRTSALKLAALALLVAAPFAAASAADGVSYNYVQGGYSKINTDTDADGWAVKGSVAVAPNFHVFGGYSDHSTDRIATIGGGSTLAKDAPAGEKPAGDAPKA